MRHEDVLDLLIGSREAWRYSSGGIHSSVCTFSASWIYVRLLEGGMRAVSRADFETQLALMQKQRELLDVISLFSASQEVDWQTYQSFWQHAIACCSFRAPMEWSRNVAHSFLLEEEHDQHRCPCFVLDMQIHGQTTATERLPIYEALLTAPSVSIVRPEYWDRIIKNLNPVRFPVEMEVCLNFNYLWFSTPVLEHILLVLQRVWAGDKEEEQQADGQEQDLLHYEVTSLVFDGNKFKTRRDFEILTEMILDDRSMIHSINIQDTFPEEMSLECLNGFRSFISQALEEGKTRRSKPVQLKNLTIGQNALSHHHYASICSALHYSSSLKELIISGYEDVTGFNQRLVWPWLALGLFHRNSRSQVHTLSVCDTNLSIGDARAFCRVVSSAQPLKEILLMEFPQLAAFMDTPDSGERMEAFSQHMRCFVRVRAETPVFAQPAIVFSNAPEDSCLPPDRCFEAIVKLKKWTYVLIPGFGYGWVANSAVVFEEFMPVEHEEGQVQPHHTVKTLLWRPSSEQDEEDTITALKLVLECIGHQLEALEIACTTISNQDLRDILCYCPRLIHLNITWNELENLEPLIQAYHDNRCIISSLNVKNDVQTEVILSELADFLKHPSSCKLKRVEAAYCSDHVESMTKLLESLLVNTTLEHLYLYRIDENICTLQPKFAAYHGQLLGTILPVQIKLAFLSVLHRYSLTADSHVLVNIFEFAGIPRRRRITWLPTFSHLT